MELSKFKELLLKVAVCAIACDDDIDEREIKALHEIEKNSPYFSALDLSETLDKALEACSKELHTFKKNVFVRTLIFSSALKTFENMVALLAYSLN